MRRLRRVLIPVLSLAALAGASCTPAPQATVATPLPSATTSSASSTPAAPQITRPTAQALPTQPPAPSTTTAVDDGPGVDGAEGIGDPYYPKSGNGGYLVDNYTISITYDPASNELTGLATITAQVTEAEPLRRFNLDLQPSMKVATVTVDAAPADFVADGSELVITPTAPLEPGAAVQVQVEYSGSPDALVDGTAGLGDGGWHRTASGGALALGEPYSASAWFPVNEHPLDPATYDITAVVPQQWQVISIGTEQPATVQPEAGWIASRWVMDKPVASYLTTLWIDKFDTTTGETDAGVPILNAIADVPQATAFRLLAAQTGPAIDTLTTFFGDFPYSSAGGIYTGESTSFALETATRPVYADWVDLETVVHELAHQWWGDDVMVASWSDICLNECFASYTPWLYFEKVSSRDPDLIFKQQMAALVNDPTFWRSPLVDMGAGNEFSAVYSRGPLALHALRHEIGDDKFFAMLKGWLAEKSGQNVTFDEWVDYTEQIAGKDLTAFVDAWFRGTTVPAEEFRYPGTLGS